MADQPAAASSAASFITPAYRRYALGILTVVYTVNYVDRQILSILLEPIKVDLSLSDTQLGLLFTTFGIFYATLGLPIAMVADRTNRRNVITAAMTVFSGMTAACAFITSFWQLLIARILVGVGEAGSSPPSHSMIADMYEPKSRATALAVFSLGVNIGIFIGFLVGGYVAQWYGWRTAFLVVGLPGLVLAVLVHFTLREPPRGHSDGRTGDEEVAQKIGQVLTFLLTQPAFRHIAAGATLVSFVGYGAVAWLPPFLVRSHGMEVGDIGLALSLIIGLAGGAGTFAAGWLADRLGQKDVRWYMWVVALAGLIAFPFGFSVYLVEDLSWALGLFIIPAAAGALYLGPSLAMTQGLAKLKMRAVASALLLFILNIIGLGLGPQAVGIVSDLLEPTYGAESLRYALLVMTPLGLWGALHFYLAARTLSTDLERANGAPAHAVPPAAEV
ncbi:MAG: MFS transporter [Parvibaculaceae bacterium]